MHNKKYSNTPNFIQGLRPFSSSIPHDLKKILKKGGYNFSHIVDNWNKIVGREISDGCYPSAVKMTKEMNNGTLVLNVLHGKEITVEYSKKEIIDKINSFFGHNYIGQIRLKVIQERREIKEKIKKPEKLIKECKNKIKTVKNINLKNSLDQLINAYHNKND